MASPWFKISPKAGACALGPAHARLSGHCWGRCLRRAGDAEDARAVPGPSASSSGADCGCCVYVSVRVAARPWGECSGGLVECQAGDVRGPLRLSRRPQPRLDPWQPGWSPSRGRPGAGPRAGRAAVAPAHLRPEVTLGSAHLGGPGLGLEGPRLWLPRGQGGPATKHQLSGFVSCPRSPP